MYNIGTYVDVYVHRLYTKLIQNAEGRRTNTSFCPIRRRRRRRRRMLNVPLFRTHLLFLVQFAASFRLLCLFLSFILARTHRQIINSKDEEKYWKHIQVRLSAVCLCIVVVVVVAVVVAWFSSLLSSAAVAVAVANTTLSTAFFFFLFFLIGICCWWW